MQLSYYYNQDFIAYLSFFISHSMWSFLFKAISMLCQNNLGNLIMFIIMSLWMIKSWFLDWNLTFLRLFNRTSWIIIIMESKLIKFIFWELILMRLIIFTEITRGAFILALFLVRVFRGKCHMYTVCTIYIRGLSIKGLLSIKVAFR